MNIFISKFLTRYFVPVIMLCFSVLWIEPITVHAELSRLDNTFSYSANLFCSKHDSDDCIFCQTYAWTGYSSSNLETVLLRLQDSQGYFYRIVCFGPYDSSSYVGYDFTKTEHTPMHTNNVTSSSKHCDNTYDYYYNFTYNNENYCCFLFNTIRPNNYVSFTLPEITTYYCDVSGSDLIGPIRSILAGDILPSITYDDEPLGPGLELIKHDFSQDIINPDIPVPQLTKISHEGFTLGNREGYAAEVIMESSLLGVQFEKQHIGMGVSDTWGFAPDDDWIYQGFYYNIADSSDVLIDSDVVNIKELYGHDNLANLIQAFKVYGEEYPKANTLPSYTWLKAGYNTQYAANHVYKSDSELSDLEQLKKSGQAVTSYYVRYVDSSGNTGRWVKYSFQDAYGTINNGMVYEGSVDVGVVEPDVNGNPVVRDEVSGSVDYDNDGEISYTPPESSLTPTVPEGEIDDSLESFNDVLEHFSDSVTNVSNFVSSMFSFLPSWTISLLGLALGAVVMLRFLGR